MDSSLSQEVLDLVEMTPVELTVLTVLRRKIRTVPVQTLISNNQAVPLILVRNGGSYGDYDGDGRFIDAATLTIDTFCAGLNANTDANLLADAVRVVLREARNVITPFGYISKVEVSDRAHRVTDWATASGPVQYADLPTGTQRYETAYRVAVRKPATNPFQTI